VSIEEDEKGMQVSREDNRSLGGRDAVRGQGTLVQREMMIEGRGGLYKLTSMTIFILRRGSL